MSGWMDGCCWVLLEWDAVADVERWKVEKRMGKRDGVVWG